MITNEDIKHIVKAIEEQTLAMNKVMELSREQLSKIDLLIEARHQNKSECELESEDEDIMDWDYISYYSDTLGKKVIGKIIGDGNDNYQVFYPLLNTSDFSCYESISGLLEDYVDAEDFMVIKSGEYSNMIPNQTDSYIVYEERDDGEDLWKASIFEEDDKMLLCDEMGNVIVEGKTYGELIFEAMAEYSLIIPIKKCISEIEL